MVTDRYTGAVENDEIHIGKTVVAYTDIIAVVAEKRTKDKGPLPEMGEEIAQDSLSLR